jgi:hypothetical protein
VRADLGGVAVFVLGRHDHLCSLAAPPVLVAGVQGTEQHLFGQTA